MWSKIKCLFWSIVCGFSAVFGAVAVIGLIIWGCSTVVFEIKRLSGAPCMAIISLMIVLSIIIGLIIFAGREDDRYSEEYSKRSKQK